MKTKLAVNRHWYDSLLDYLPTKLTIWDQIGAFAQKSDNKFAEALKQQNLKNLKHLKMNGERTFKNLRVPDTERFESKLVICMISDIHVS